MRSFIKIFIDTCIAMPIQAVLSAKMSMTYARSGILDAKEPLCLLSRLSASKDDIPVRADAIDRESRKKHWMLSVATAPYAIHIKKVPCRYASSVEMAVELSSGLQVEGSEMLPDIVRNRQA